MVERRCAQGGRFLKEVAESSKTRALGNLFPNKSQFEIFSKYSVIIPHKRKMGTPKEPLTADGLCLRQILGAPLRHGSPMFALPPLGTKKPFPKKVFAELFP